MFPTSPLRELVERLDGEPETLDDESLNCQVEGALDLIERAQAAAAVLIGEWDARGLWETYGTATPAQWLARRGTLSSSEARGLARTARAIHGTDKVKAALESGRLRFGQARALARVRLERTARAFDEQEAKLVGIFGQLKVDYANFVAQRWLALADPDGPDPGTCSPTASISVSWGGTHYFDATLDAEGGSIVEHELDHIMKDLHRAAVADGLQPPTVGRLRADAFVEMARRASAVRSDKPGARPLVLVKVDLDDLLRRDGTSGPATTDAGVVIRGDVLRRWMCDADISRVVVNGASEVLDVGRSERTATAAQRRALLIRDGGCVFPGCDRPPGWCEAHHIVWWEDLGPTDLENLCLLCSRHHHLIHSGKFRVRRRQDGTHEFTRADGTILDPDPFYDVSDLLDYLTG